MEGYVIFFRQCRDNKFQDTLQVVTFETHLSSTHASLYVVFANSNRRGLCALRATSIVS